MYNNLNYNTNHSPHGHGSPHSSVPPPQAPPSASALPAHLQYPPGYYYPNPPQPYMYPPANQGVPPNAGQQQHQQLQPPLGTQPSVNQGGAGAPTAAGKNSSTAGSRRGPWQPQEDKKLLDLISVFGPTNWVRISNSLATRTPKQCRERFHQNLKPSLNRAPITVEEGELIESLVAKYGKKWAEISRHMNGRSDNAIKNWWNGGANRRRRASVTGSTPGTGSASADDSHDEADEPDTDGSGTEPSRKASVSQVKTEFVEPIHRNSSSSSINSTKIKPSSSSISSVSATTNPPTNSTNPTAVPSQYPQVHLPQISFNTSMFGKPDNSPMPSLAPANSPYKSASASVSSSAFVASRSASFDINSKPSTTLPPISSTNKRRLLDDPISRRHSTANSAVYHNNHHQPGTLTSSHPNLSAISQSGNMSPSYYGSPLLLSTQASRNNSISFEFSTLNSTTNSSRRSSSIAPDLFPNPLKDIPNTHKRNISQNSSYNSPCLTPSTRFSVSSNTSVLNPASSSAAKEEELTHKKPKDVDMDHEGSAEEKQAAGVKTKISVSSLIS